jgi:hypothetical protein
VLTSREFVAGLAGLAVNEPPVVEDDEGVGVGVDVDCCETRGKSCVKPRSATEQADPGLLSPLGL